MNSRLALLALSLVVGVTTASAASLTLPKGYKGVLDCPAIKGTSNMMVAMKGEDYFLAAKVDKAVKLFALEVTDGDMGYMTYIPADAKAFGKLAKQVEYIYVYNDEEEIEDTNDAVITGGALRVESRDEEQECSTIGKVRINR